MAYIRYILFYIIRLRRVGRTIGTTGDSAPTLCVSFEKRSAEERDYVLFRLVSAKFDGEQPPTRVPLYRPDKTMIGGRLKNADSADHI
jgi:hypothetical protein